MVEPSRPRLCLSADGASSWSRQHVGQETRVKAYQHFGMVARFTCEKFHHQIAHQWFLPNSSILAYLPSADHEISIVWSHPNPEHVMTTDFANQVEIAGQHQLGHLQLLGDVQSFPLALRRVHLPYHRRIVWIGDAARTVHPLAGQGMNLGLEDVRTLLRITQKEHDPGAAHVMRRFVRERYWDGETVQRMCDVLYGLFGHQAQTVGLFRNAGMSWVNRMSWFKNWLIHQAQGS